MTASKILQVANDKTHQETGIVSAPAGKGAGKRKDRIMYSEIWDKKTDFRFKEDLQKSEPFPPSYYECEKRAKELFTQLHNPKLSAKKTYF